MRVCVRMFPCVCVCGHRIYVTVHVYGALMLISGLPPSLFTLPYLNPELAFQLVHPAAICLRIRCLRLPRAGLSGE